jgi:hypothetical protein
MGVLRERNTVLLSLKYNFRQYMEGTHVSQLVCVYREALFVTRNTDKQQFA